MLFEQIIIDFIIEVEEHRKSCKQPWHFGKLHMNLNTNIKKTYFIVYAKTCLYVQDGGTLMLFKRAAILKFKVLNV